VSDPSPTGVAAVFAAIDETASCLGRSDQDNFAFNVLVNALATVLESIRANRPDELPMYQGIARAMLSDDR